MRLESCPRIRTDTTGCLAFSFTAAAYSSRRIASSVSFSTGLSSSSVSSDSVSSPSVSFGSIKMRHTLPCAVVMSAYLPLGDQHAPRMSG